MNALQIQTTHSGVMGLDTYPASALPDALRWCDAADSYAVSYAPGCLPLVSEIRERLNRIAKAEAAR